MSIKLLSALAGLTLAATCRMAAQPVPVTINFASLGAVNSVAGLNAELTSYGVTVDAGNTSNFSAGGGNDVTTITDPAEADLLFNFSSPVDSVSATFGFSSNPIGLTGFDVNTTASGASALDGGPDDIAYEGGTEGQTLTLNAPDILAIQGEDEGEYIGISTLTFIPAPVPEPATCGLLAIGAVAVLGARYRRSTT